MQTIKTAVVVVMMLAVIYGVFVALNGTDAPLPRELEDWANNLPDMPSVESPNPFDQPKGSDSSVAVAEIGASSKPSFAIPNLSLPPLAMNNQEAAPLGAQAFSERTPPSLSEQSSAEPPKAPEFSPPRELINDFPGGTSTSTASSQPSFTAPTNTVASAELSLPNIHGRDVENSRDLLEPNKVAQSPWTSPSTPNLVSTSIPETERQPLGIAQGEDDAPTSKLDQPVPVSMSPTSRSFENAKKLAFEQIGQGKLKEALATLSMFYNSPELSTSQFYELLDILDPLAAEVIYSRRHLLDIPHEVAPGETMEQISRMYDVPTDILNRINAIQEGRNPPVGTKLKIIPGPFRAEIELKKGELTLFVGELYAGRFPIAIGQDPAPREGVFQVVDKQTNRNYYGKGGVQISAAAPNNPYGGYWIDLGQDLCIHGSPASPNTTPAQGCIGLSPQDARDVFGMLSRGSQVQIRR